MTISYKLLFALFLLPFFSIAQSNYQPGYVVTLKGDTLHGVIDYKEWDNNPKKIRFKNNLNPEKIEIFSTTNTRAFNIKGGKYYQGFTLPISQDQVETGNLPDKLDTTYINDTVFLQVVVTGKHLTLYNYVDNIKTRYYVLEANETTPEELVYHAYYNPDTSSSIRYIRRYRSQLAYFAGKFNVSSSSLENQILQANYTEPDLVKIVNIINDNSSEQFSSKKLSGSRWFVGIGLNSSNLKFTQIRGTATGSNSITNYNSIFPKITTGIDFFPNKSIQQLFLRTELSVTMDQYNASTLNSGPPQSTSTLNFKQFNSALSLQIGYNFYNCEKLKVFLAVGPALNLSSYNQYKYITTYEGTFPDNIKDNYPVLSSFWLSFPIKAGIAINNKIELSICYIPSSSITTDNPNSVNITSFQAGFNYLFK